MSHETPARGTSAVAKITENSTVQLGLIITVIGLFLGVLVGAVWWASAMDTNTRSIKETMAEIQAEIKEANRDRWTKHDHDAYALVLDKRIGDIEKRQQINQDKILDLQVEVRASRKTP